jgi:hypothetical protein
MSAKKVSTALVSDEALGVTGVSASKANICRAKKTDATTAIILPARRKRRQKFRNRL